jgi:hypothetical protein
MDERYTDGVKRKNKSNKFIGPPIVNRYPKVKLSIRFELNREREST